MTDLGKVVRSATRRTCDAAPGVQRCRYSFSGKYTSDIGGGTGSRSGTAAGHTHGTADRAEAKSADGPEVAKTDWLSTYVGLPYELADCWQPARRVMFEQFSVKLPSYHGVEPDRVIADCMAIVFQVDEPALGDLVLMQRLGWPHVAVALGNGWILHTTSSTNAVRARIDPARHKIVGYFRARRA